MIAEIGEKFDDLAGDEDTDLDDQFKHNLEYSLKLVRMQYSDPSLYIESKIHSRILRACFRGRQVGDEASQRRN